MFTMEPEKPVSSLRVLTQKSRTIALALVGVSCLIKLAYIFFFTSYRDSVQFDMSAYWYGAFDLIWGGATGVGQYAIFPPFYSNFLSQALRLIDPLDLISYSIPLAIVANVVLYGISAFMVYLIADRLILRKVLVFLALGVYAFSYTATYFNALILAENLAMPLLVIAVALLMLGESLSLKRAGLSGFLLGVAIAAKPLFVFLGFAFLGYVLVRDQKNRYYLKTTVFVIALLAVPFFATAENYKISGGRLLGLGSNGGVNFFQGWAHPARVHSTTKDGYYWVQSPSSIDEPSWKPFSTDQPFYNQWYYYKLGLKAIRNDPAVLVNKLLWFGKLFFGVLVPTLVEPPAGYDQMMPLAQMMWYVMFVFLGVIFLFFLDHSDRGRVLFLYSLMASFLLSVYLMGMPERRYLYFIEFLIVVLFFLAVDKACGLFGIYKKELGIYLFSVLCFCAVVPFTYGLVQKYLG